MVHLIHETARTFLLRDSQHPVRYANLQGTPFDCPEFQAANCHAIIARTCLENLDELRKSGVFDRRHHGPLTASEMLRVNLAVFGHRVLLRYAIRWWWKHAQSTEPQAKKDLAELAFQLLTQGDTHISSWMYLIELMHEERGFYKGDVAPLLYAACIGFPELVSRLLLSKADINVRGPDGETPLTAAATYGHLETVRMLIEEGAALIIGREENCLLQGCTEGYSECGGDAGGRRHNVQPRFSIRPSRSYADLMRRLRSGRADEFSRRI